MGFKTSKSKRSTIGAENISFLSQCEILSTMRYDQRNLHQGFKNEFTQRWFAHSKALIETVEEEYLPSVVHEDNAACLQFAKIQKPFSCTKHIGFSTIALGAKCPPWKLILKQFHLLINLQIGLPEDFVKRSLKKTAYYNTIVKVYWYGKEFAKDICETVNF